MHENKLQIEQMTAKHPEELKIKKRKIVQEKINQTRSFLKHIRAQLEENRMNELVKKGLAEANRPIEFSLNI